MSTRSLILSGIKWSFGSQVLLQLIDIVVTAILSRLLAPNDFGLFAVVFVALNLFNNLKNLGFGSALIQRKEPTNLEISSIFWLNAFVGLCFTLVLFIASDSIGAFFSKDGLPFLLRLVSVVYIIRGLTSVPATLIQKKLQFRAIFKMNASTVIIANGVAILAAQQGFGVLSLAFRMITGSVIGLLLNWYVSGYKPSLSFNWSALKPYFNFGWPIFLDGILGYGLRNLDNILIGKYFSATTLGFYNKSYQLMVLPLRNITQVLGGVMFPTLSKMNDPLVLKKAYLKSISLVSFVSFPAMFGLSVLSEEAILIIYGNQWRPAIPYLQILCITGAFQPLASMAGNYYLVKGKTFLSLKVSAFSRVFMMSAMIFGIQYGALGVAISYTISSLIAFIPEVYFTSKLIGIHIVKALGAFASNLLMTILMAIIVFAIKYNLESLNNHLVFRTLLLLLSGIVIYFTLSYFFNRKILNEYISILKNITSGQ